MSSPFYITTPIYYVNDEPHLGHAYTTILADVLARYARLRGQETFFLTGTDEHGQKVQQAAKKNHVDPQTQADRMVLRFQQVWQGLHISHDTFLRTTETRHIDLVTHVLQTLSDQGQIYKAAYQGWYCVPCERFWTEKDLQAGQCPDCHRAVEQVTEANYFFRMSAYQTWLIDYIKQQPNFIQPRTRRNEVLGFLRSPLGDLCISRPVSRVSWGIPLPFDPDYVTYVWFDALFNYVTALDYLDDRQHFARFWASAIHLIGKDILTTHCVYWPTMLKAMGLPLPQTIWAHGWWIGKDAEKISKSRGNAIKPLNLAEIYGVDAFRYFLMRDMTLGRDAHFSEDALCQRYESDLANNLGNLLHRLIALLKGNCQGSIPASGPITKAEQSLQQQATALVSTVFTHIETMALNQALGHIITFISQINTYLEHTAPWREAKAGHQTRVDTILYHTAEALRLASVLLHPVLPERTVVLWSRLGWQSPPNLADSLVWGKLKTGAKVETGPALFPKEVLGK